VPGPIKLFRTAIGPRRPSHNVAVGEKPSHVSAKEQYWHDATNPDLTLLFDDAHAPLVSDGQVRKVVAKIAV
jgi:hypothetical protein